MTQKSVANNFSKNRCRPTRWIQVLRSPNFLCYYYYYYYYNIIINIIIIYYISEINYSTKFVFPSLPKIIFLKSTCFHNTRIFVVAVEVSLGIGSHWRIADGIVMFTWAFFKRLYPRFYNFNLAWNYHRTSHSIDNESWRVPLQSTNILTSQSEVRESKLTSWYF